MVDIKIIKNTSKCINSIKHQRSAEILIKSCHLPTNVSWFSFLLQTPRINYLHTMYNIIKCLAENMAYIMLSLVKETIMFLEKVYP